ncbi:MAG: exopolysaccharide Pel transporter PelG, partial [Bryobacteraceae bacterium]
GSFLVGGGFVQIMARRGLFLAGSNQFRRCEQATWLWARRGVAATFLAAAVFFAASLYWDWLPISVGLTTAAFCVALSLFWISTGIFHVLGRGLLVAWVTLAGIALVGALRFGLHAPLVISQLLGILIAAAAAFVISARLLRRRAAGQAAAEERSSFLRDAFFLWPYFSYGILYYLLLFADRLVAWTAQTHATALAVQFRGDYETALNLGLVSFIVEVGWVHCSTANFYVEAAEAQKQYSIANVDGFRQEMVRFYWKRLARFVPVAVAASLLALLVAAGGAFLHGTVVETAACSLAGFPFLIVGLWNVSLLFGLSMAPKAVAATAIACLVDLAAGYILTRIGDYHYAIAGFLLGAVVFALLPGFWALRAFRKLDYFYFAASA